MTGQRDEYEGANPRMVSIELSEIEWNRVLMGLTVYANTVEERGNDEHAGELRGLGRRIAQDMEAEL